MAALVYDLTLTEFDHRPFERTATYETGGSFGRLTVTLGEDELLGEFGTVPAFIRVSVRVGNDIPPADAWLDAPGQVR